MWGLVAQADGEATSDSEKDIVDEGSIHKANAAEARDKAAREEKAAGDAEFAKAERQLDEDHAKSDAAKAANPRKPRQQLPRTKREE